MDNRSFTTLFAEPLRFAPVFKDFYNQQEDIMHVQSLIERFASAKEMENHFRNQDQKQWRRRYHMREEWTWQNNDFNNTMNDMHDIFRDDNMWKDM